MKAATVRRRPALGSLGPVVLSVLLSGAGPACFAYTPPSVFFGFLPVQPPDSDPSPFVATAESTFVVGGGTRVFHGWGSASLPAGKLKVRQDERYSGPSANVPFSDIGHSSVANIYDTLVAGANGSITLTLTGHALLSWSELTDGGLVDKSWAGYGFSLFGQVYNPGTGGFTGGGGQGLSRVEVQSNRAAPLPQAVDSGAAGLRKSIDASFVLTPDGGTFTLTAWMNAGDRFNFRAMAIGSGWADSLRGAYATADLSNTASLSVSGSPGMTWTAESGALLTAVPEPGAWALLLAGLGFVGFVARRRG